MFMKRIIKLLPVAAVLCIGAVSCDKDDNDDNDDVNNPNIYLGHEYVDLGLKVKWATCNVGAEKPEDYGDYFAWGDTTTKYEPGYAQSESPQWKDGMWDGYSWVNYRFSNETSNSLFKYCDNIDYGFDDITDTLTILTPADDVAHYKWGGNWRMPTQADFDELLKNCDCNYTTQNGVKGWKFTGNNNNSIFLPEAGDFEGTTCGGEYGAYWSGTMSGFESAAMGLVLMEEDSWFTSEIPRIYGNTVRPVKVVKP